MAAGINPIYCKAPQVEFAKVTSGNNVAISATNSSLVLAGSTLGTDVFTVFTADATNGGYIQKIRCKPGTSATACALTCLRVFLYNGVTSPATAGSSIFWDDLTLPATTPAVNAQSPAFELQMNLALPLGWSVVVCLAQAPATGSWQISAVGGKY